MGIMVHVMEWAFVSLTAAIIVLEFRMKRLDKKTQVDSR